jgi:uncharacterized membrane protein YgcG
MEPLKEIRDKIFQAQNELQDKVEAPFYTSDYLEALKEAVAKVESLVDEFKKHPDAPAKIAKWESKDRKWAIQWNKTT